MFAKGYYVTAEIKANDGIPLGEIRKALVELSEASAREPGCSLFLVHQDQRNPSHFVLWERFESEQDFKTHIAEPHTKKYGALGYTEMVKAVQSDIIQE